MTTHDEDLRPIADDDPPTWRDLAACREMGPSWFYPTKGRPTEAVKRFCRENCAVTKECLDWAMTPPMQVHGIWGGTSELDRRRMRRSQRLAVRPL